MLEGNIPRIGVKGLGLSLALALGSACGPESTATGADAGVDTHPLTAVDGGQDLGQDGGDAAEERPNILLIVADDLGYSDLGAFGGEIRTPNLDLLASEGRLLTDHHTAMTCSPTRAMLTSGTDHHLVGLGRMGPGVGSQEGEPGYEGYLNDRALSVAQLLKDGGYHTYISGKWHLGIADDQTPRNWGYERSFVLLGGHGTHFREFSNPPTEGERHRYREDGVYTSPPPDFYSSNYYTDRLIDFIDSNRGDGKPFYAFASYTAPHWPIQAPDDFIDRYVGVYDAGYEAIRAARFERQKRLGIVPADYKLPPVQPSTPVRKLWSELTDDEKRYEARAMEVYAGMVENLDWNVGRIIQYLKCTGQYENTFIWFQSDNGAESSREKPAPGDSLANLGREGSRDFVGPRWAEVSNTPFRLWKHTLAEGGASSPVITRLPRQHAQRPQFGGLTHVTDLAPTFLELAGVPDPGSEYKGRRVEPITGKSLLPMLEWRSATVRSENDVLADEQNNHRYVMRGRWKLVWLAGQVAPSPPRWQLFDVWTDRGETTDVAGEHPEVVAELRKAFADYKQWAGVITTDGVD
jgi:arylsulfatase A-like enzyme